MYLIQITDTHILADPHETFDGVDSAATLRAVMEHIRAQESPDLLLLTGDLVHEPDAASYQRLNTLLHEAPAPVYAIPGNHDDPGLMRECLQKPIRYERELEGDGWRILLLNSWLPGEHAGRLPPGELSWLDGQMEAGGETPTLVAVHHPPVNIGSPWMDAMGLYNADDLLAVLGRHAQVRGVVWGHIHQEFDAERDGLRLLGCPSTCVQFRPGSKHYEKDDLGPGYRRLWLKENGELVTEVIRA